MADQPPRGRGRGRGRGRDAVQQGAAAQPPPAPVRAAAAPLPNMGRGRGRGRGRGGAVASAAVPQDAGDLAAGVGQLAIRGTDKGTKEHDVAIGRGSVRPRRDEGTVLVTTPPTVSIKQGTDGVHAKFVANYFQLCKVGNWSLCKHHVDFVPEEKRTWVKKRLLGQHKDRFQGYVFDGSTLFTFVNACPDGKPREYVSRWKTGHNENGSEILTDYTIALKFVGTIEPSDYQYLQLFNLILRDCMEKMGLTQMRRDYYDTNAVIHVTEYKLDLYPGYSTSFLQCENQIMLQVEIKYKIARQDSVYDLFRRIQSSHSRAEDLKKAFMEAVLGCVIMTIYNKKTYRIDDVAFNVTPNDTFPVKTREGTKNIKYADYFRDKYGHLCRDPGQPMLVSRSNAKQRRAGEEELILLVPEFCIFTGLTDDMRKDFRLMKAVNTTTCLNPAIRMKRLVEFNDKLRGIPAVADKLNSWGLGLDADLVQIDGRILPPQTIVVKGQEHSAGKDANWDRSLRSNHMLQAVNIERWLLIVPRNYAREAKEFYTNYLSRAANGMKYTIARPEVIEIQRDNFEQYVAAIGQGMHQYNPQLVMCIVPNTNAERYSHIKRQCILDKPVPSQVVLVKNISDKKAMSVATKVAIQMNCKMGGAPWATPKWHPDKTLMVFGYDVCHDPRDKRRSFGALVASLDTNCVRWCSNVTHHSAGEELSISFSFNVMKCMSLRLKRGPLPDYIVIYRDGLGEGQLEQSLNIELKGVKEELEPLYKKEGKELRIAFVIVTKRINTRIFKDNANPPPGTIIDSVITNPFRYEFFLVSQSVNQGTVTPTHYNVIGDTTGIPPNIMQRLTYRMTHMYFNWSGTVRVPAPCQYAHKLAFLTAQSIKVQHSNLDELLYFL